MPLYDFECRECQGTFEALTHPQDVAIECKLCKTRLVDGEPCVTRLVSAPAGHIWKCSTDGAMPRSKNADEDRRLKKRERVTGMLDRQAKDLS